MPRCVTVFIIIGFLCGSINLQAQDPSWIDWKKITTPHFEIVFPKGISDEAQKTANLLEHIYQPVSHSLFVQPKPISVFIHNQTTVSNGSVRYAPRLSNWNITPPQSARQTGANNWFQMLAVHEYRHVVQQEKKISGFTKLARYLYGDLALINLQWSEPLWFDEGDAVYAETVLTNWGRGRIPAFDMHIRSLLLSGKTYTYDKAVFGSYKHFYPSHYHLGYLMVNHVYRNYGIDAWSKILNHEARCSFLPWAFSRGVKKITKKNVAGIYSSAMQELDSLWTEQISNTPTEVADRIHRKKDDWINYYSPQMTENSTIVARKYGLGIPNSLTVNDTLGNELYRKQISSTSKISVSANKVVWTNRIPHLRWTMQDYSVIMLHDLKTHKTTRLTKKTKLFSPSLSHDGSKIAAVEYSTDMVCMLVILDSKTGNELKRFMLPDNHYIRNPAWSPDDKQLVFAHSGSKGNALSTICIQSGDITRLIPYANHNLDHPVFYKQFILFDSPYSGIGNIYAIHRKTLQQYQVTSHRFGAYHTSITPDKQYMLYQNYTTNGYDIAKKALTPATWKPVEAIEPRRVLYCDKMILQEKGGDIFSKNIGQKKYEIKDYSKFANLINIHSWGLFPKLTDMTDNNYLPNEINFQIFSRNNLNTMQANANFGYNLNENTKYTALQFVYSGFYPEFGAGIKHGGRKTNNIKAETIRWDETTITGGIQLPLQLSKGIYYSSLQLSTEMEYIKQKNIHNTTTDISFDDTDKHTLIHELRYYILKKPAVRDISYRLGINCNAAYYHTPFDKKDVNMFSARLSVYLPGIFRHHATILKTGYETQNNKDLPYSGLLYFPRGYDYTFYKHILQAGIDYKFPIWYPDINIGSLIYFKRLKGGLFYDYTRGWNTDLNITSYQSAGAELSVDFYPFRLHYAFDAGIRFSYRLNDDAYRISGLFFGVNF